jgi:hypothetical protein
MPPSNIATLVHYGSRYPTGVNTAAFMRMLWHCIRCDHFLFADSVHMHKCPGIGHSAGPLPADFDIVDYLTAEGSRGLHEAQLLSVTARCTLCDRLVYQGEDEGDVRHRCDAARW